MPEFEVINMEDVRANERVRRVTEPGSDDVARHLQVPGTPGKHVHARHRRITEPSGEYERHLLSDTDTDEAGNSTISRSGIDLRVPVQAGRAFRPPLERHYSVISGAHEFDVTNYGAVSIDKCMASAARKAKNISGSTFRVSMSDGGPILEEVTDIQDATGHQSDQVDEDNNLKAIFSLDFEKTRDNVDSRSVRLMQPYRSNVQQDSKTLDIAKRGRAFAKRKKDRLVEKNGECRIVYSKVTDRKLRFLNDLFTTMLELKWRYHFLTFSLAFGVSWLLFALIWWGLVSINRSSLLGHDAHNDTSQDPYTTCVHGVTDFPTALLFSIETQHTIGYGTRAITPYCPFATLLLMIQSMFGVIMQCILTGIIFAKMARPKRRAHTILFSKKAVVCPRDGQRFLMFRVGDMRKSQVLGVTIRVMLAERRVTKEGENLPIVTQDIPVTTESGSSFMFLAWPLIVVHRIDEDSPLWSLSAVELIKQDWELIVVLEGVGEVTGASFQVRTSYLPSEILWGERLKSLLSKSTGGVYRIDYTFFHDTVEVKMSDTSAREEALSNSTIPRENGVHTLQH